HFHLEVARAFAGFAASAANVEAERPGRVAAFAGEGLVGEDAADLVERFHVGDGVGARRFADGTLVDEDDVGEGVPAGDGVELAGALAQVAFGAVFAAEAGLERAVEHVVDERALAASRHAGDHGEAA